MISRAQDLYNKLVEDADMGPDGVMEAHDTIERLSKLVPEMTAQCSFFRSMQVRRLLNIKPEHWNPMDLRRAEQIVIEIERLKDQQGSYESVLALAVLGVRRKSYPLALKKLDTLHEERLALDNVRKAGNREAQEGQEPVVAAGDDDGDEVSIESAESGGEPPGVLSSVGEIDRDELDPETAEALKVLEAEVRQVEGKNEG